MADVDVILSSIMKLLTTKKRLAGKRVLITAGPTREPIDAVRYISNRSSGKMGFAIAEAALALGADVTVVAGPSSVSDVNGANVVHIETAREMYEATLAEFDNADYVVAAAAVADFRPADASSHKLKKDKFLSSVAIEPTDDLLAELGRRKRHQVLIGFAAETDNLEENARKKLEEKKLDWIVANDVTREGAGFDIDTNIVSILGAKGQYNSLPLLGKRDVADELWSLVIADRD
jgi:phosphopantothenoylcysteine decarboxylase/phosphopantothenate--cysteine ligase